MKRLFALAALALPLFALAQVIYPPAAPHMLVALSKAGEVRWQMDGEQFGKITSFDVQRDGGVVKHILPDHLDYLARHDLTTFYWRDVTALPGKRYAYRVRAYDLAGNPSPWSTEQEVRYHNK